MHTKTGTYEEEGWVAKVEIVSDDSDDEWEKYSLKVIRTIIPSPIFGSQENGKVFEVSFKRKYSHYKNWRLILDSSPRVIQMM